MRKKLISEGWRVCVCVVFLCELSDESGFCGNIVITVDVARNPCR